MYMKKPKDPSKKKQTAVRDAYRSKGGSRIRGGATGSVNFENQGGGGGGGGGDFV